MASTEPKMRNPAVLTACVPLLSPTLPALKFAGKIDSTITVTDATRDDSCAVRDREAAVGNSSDEA